MVKVISHRSNLNGIDPSRENCPECIKEVISLGFDCEIDISCKRIFEYKSLFLGHDEPMYHIEIDFLLKNAPKLFIHCKDFNSLDYLQKFNELNIFFHNRDEHVFTSKGNLITHQDQPKTTKNGIIVLKDKPTRQNLPMCAGLITDWPILAKEIYEENKSI